jgi:hypothetical protein
LGYSHHRIREQLLEVSEDAQVAERWPKTAKVLEALATALEHVVHDMDWDLSGDTEVHDDAKFDRECVEKIFSAAETDE